MPKQTGDADESAGRRARRLGEEIVLTLRGRFPAAHVRFSQLDTGGADGVLIVRAPEEERETVEAAAEQLVAESVAGTGLWIEPRFERPRGERRDRAQGEGFRGGFDAGGRGFGQAGGKGKRLPRKTAP
jgi:hypothetical protein